MKVSHLLTNATPGSIEALQPQETRSDLPGEGLAPIVLGKDLADSLGASVGDKVTLISPQGDLTPYGVIPKWVPFRLAGTYHTAFTSTTRRRALCGWPTRSTSSMSRICCQ